MTTKKLLDLHPNPKYIFGPDDWKKYLGICFDDCLDTSICWESSIFNSQPFPNARKLRDHAFIFMPEEIEGEPLTILWWHKFLKGHPKFNLEDDQWYMKETFAIRVTPQPRWHCMPANVQPQTIGFGIDYQMFFQKRTGVYTITPAVVEVTKNILLYFKNGSFPNPKQRARCAETLTGQYRVSVGKTKERSLGIGKLPNQAIPDVGLALERIPKH